MSSLDKLSKGMKKMFHDSKIGKSLQCTRGKGTAIAKKMSALLYLLFFFLKTLCIMIKLWFVPEILVFAREMSLKFDFGGRHACNVKGSNFFCLFKILGTYLGLIFFFCHVQNNERSGEKKTEIEQSDYKVVF